MLNTDAHNPSILVPSKMTKDEFIRNNRGINDGCDLPPLLLHGLYDNILQHPLRLRNHNNHCKNNNDYGPLFTDPVMTGWVLCGGEKGLFYRPRYCRLSNHVLYSFTTQCDLDPISILPLENIQVTSNICEHIIV